MKPLDHYDVERIACDLFQLPKCTVKATIVLEVGSCPKVTAEYLVVDPKLGIGEQKLTEVYTLTTRHPIDGQS